MKDKSKVVEETLIDLIGANMALDEMKAKATTAIREAYGVKSGKRIAKRHRLRVEEHIARAIVACGRYPGVTTKKHGKGWAMSHPDGREAAEAAKKMKQRLLSQVMEDDGSPDSEKQTPFDRLLSSLTSWVKRMGNMKLTASQRAKLRAALEVAIAELS